MKPLPHLVIALCAATSLLAQKPTPASGFSNLLQPPPLVLHAQFVDHTNGLSFRYPTAWKPATGFGYHPPGLTYWNGKAPIAGFGYVAANVSNDPYEKTDLEGLGVLYSAQYAASEASCNAVATSAVGEDEPSVDGTPDPNLPRQNLLVDGVRFTIHPRGAAGMNQSTTGAIYAAFRDGRCFLVETAVSVANGLGYDDPKNHRPVDVAALLRRLEDIVRSVRLMTPATVAPRLTAYSDEKIGVRFDYPAVWTPLKAGTDMAAPIITTLSGGPPVTFVFSPKRNFYEKTNLVGLSFSYAVLPAKTYDQCTGIAKEHAPNPSGTDDGHYGGNEFSEFTADDAAACHSVHRVLDTTLFRSTRGGAQCAIFERDFETACPDTADGHRTLTAGETTALQRHLDEIMATIILQ